MAALKPLLFLFLTSLISRNKVEKNLKLSSGYEIPAVGLGTNAVGSLWLVVL